MNYKPIDGGNQEPIECVSENTETCQEQETSSTPITVAVRFPSIATVSELYNLKNPTNLSTVHVEDEDADYIYIEQSKSWVKIECSSHNDYIRYDEDDKLAANKLLFNTIDLNAIILYIIIMTCILVALYVKSTEVASMLAGVLAGKASETFKSKSSK